jgi:AcrR family transcriptional regulator
MSSEKSAAARKQSRGRPRRAIDLEAVETVATELFTESGLKGLSVEAVAERLSISRSTLYRTIETREALAELVLSGIHLRLMDRVDRIAAEGRDASWTLRELIRAQVEVGSQLGPFQAMYFGALTLRPETEERIRRWNHDYEAFWRVAVTRAMREGVLPDRDPVLTTRLIIGMLNWIPRWNHASDTEPIADAAVALVLRSAGAEDPAVSAPPRT